MHDVVIVVEVVVNADVAAVIVHSVVVVDVGSCVGGVTAACYDV